MVGDSSVYLYDGSDKNVKKSAFYTKKIKKRKAVCLLADNITMCI